MGPRARDAIRARERQRRMQEQSQQQAAGEITPVQSMLQVRFPQQIAAEIALTTAERDGKP